MGREIRWSIGVLVLAVVGVIALWPRGAPNPEDNSGDGAPPSDRSSLTASPPAMPPEPDSALAGPRAAAALASCPPARPGGPEQLRGERVPCMAGGNVDLGAALAGRTTLVNVWATWCAPCRDEMPALQRYADRPGSAGVLGVQVRSPQSAGLRMLAELGVHYPSVADPDNSVQKALRTPHVLPASYLVLPDGAVRRLPPQAFTDPDEVAAAVNRARAAPGASR